MVKMHHICEQLYHFMLLCLEVDNTFTANDGYSVLTMNVNIDFLA